MPAKTAKRPVVVVVGLDGSVPSSKALDEALRQCKASGARLHIVHVLAMPVVAAASAQGMAWANVLEAMEADGQAIVRRGAKAADAAGIPHRERIVESQDAAAAIVQEAERVSAALVVVGSHGRTGIRRILLGSVAERVVRLAHCPVLVVR